MDCLWKSDVEEESYSIYCGGNIVIPKERKNVIAIGGNISNENQETMSNNFCNSWDCFNGVKITDNIFSSKDEIVTLENDKFFFTLYRIWFVITLCFVLAIIICIILIALGVINSTGALASISLAFSGLSILATQIRDFIKVELRRTVQKLSGLNESLEHNRLDDSQARRDNSKVKTEEKLIVEQTSTFSTVKTKESSPKSTESTKEKCLNKDIPEIKIDDLKEVVFRGKNPNHEINPNSKSLLLV